MSSKDIKEAIDELDCAGEAYVVATVVRTEPPTSAKAGDTAVLDGTGILAGWVGGGCAKPAVTRNAIDALSDGQTRLIRISRDLSGLESGIMGYPMTCQSGGTLDIFIEPVMPRSLLVIIGHTAIAKALCSLAAGAGYDVLVAAPGGKRDQFPAADDWLEDLDEIAKIERKPNAIIVATQGSGDARGLESALATNAAYIGLIASPKKSERLKETLKKRGNNAAAVDSIDGPAGLDIGAVSPQEVAISVLAELVRRRRSGELGDVTEGSGDTLAGDGDNACCSSRQRA